VAFALITWRTGGLETAVVLHAANNAFGLLLVLVLHADLGALTDRSTGAGSVVYLIPVVLLAIITAVVWYRTRHDGPALTPSADDPSGRYVKNGGLRVMDSTAALSHD
jgi:membrane protease YdiL (CAAX protease family)